MYNSRIILEQRSFYNNLSVVSNCGYIVSLQNIYKDTPKDLFLSANDISNISLKGRISTT